MAEVLSGATGALQGTLGGVLNKGQAWIDSIISPETRNEIIAKISKFAHEKPALASFIASQIALTGFPLGLFMVMTISVVIFAILAGLIIGLVGAVLFIVTCVGFALIILLPTLFITTAIATFIWLWGFGTYYIVKKYNQKEIPGIHKPLNNSVPDSIKGQLGGISGEGGPQADPSEKSESSGEPNGRPKEGNRSGAGKDMNGIGDKVDSAGKSTGLDVGSPKEAADMGKHAGKAQNATGGATNAVRGAKGAVSGTFGV